MNDQLERDIRNLFCNTGELSRDEVTSILLGLLERIQHLEQLRPAQEPVACRYGDNGYACCEGGPCAAEEHNDKTDWQERGMVAEAALAKLLDEKNEPVAWATQMNEYGHIHWGAKRPEYPMVYEFPLYTSPPASKPWVSLTDEEVRAVRDSFGDEPVMLIAFARAIDARGDEIASAAERPPADFKPRPARGYLSTSGGRWRVISQALPISDDKATPAAALAAARQLGLELEAAAWNGDRGEWVWLETIAELEGARA